MLNSTALTPAANTKTSPWRSAGVWMIVILIGYILFNAVRATLGPVDFANYYGLPLDADESSAFVLVYAIRALFLGLFGLALLSRRDFKALALYALVGAVMPLGDAGLVLLEGGPTATVIRHLLTAGFLILTWFLLRRWTLRQQRAAD